MKRADSKQKGFLLHAVGIILCILPPALATLTYFPLWRGEEPLKLVSGITVLLLAFCARPLFKLISERFKSAASLGLWLVLFVLFFALRRVSDEMVVISFWGLVGNAVGGVCLAIAKRGEASDG